MRWLAFVAGLIALAAACSSAGDGTPTADAGAGDSGIATGDATVHAPGIPFCPDNPSAILCDHFDASTLSPAWIPRLQNGGSVGVDAGALVATVPVLPGQADGGSLLAEAYASVTVPLPPETSIHVVIDFTLASAGDRGAELVTLGLEDGLDFAQFFVFDRGPNGAGPVTTFGTDRSTNGPTSFGNTTDYADAGTSTLATQLAYRLTIDLDYGDVSDPRVSATIVDPNAPEGTAPFLDVNEQPIDWAFVPTSFYLDVGATDVSLPTADAWQVVIHDVVVTPLQ